MRLFLVVFATSVLILVSASAAPMPWAQLKVGMSVEEIVSVLGDPVLRIKGRGFETWTYDHGAEVLVYGLLVGWTAPDSTSLAIRSQDVWASRPRGDYFGTLRSAVVRKPKQRPPVIVAEAVPNHAGMGYEQYLKSLYRAPR
jgi:hypothetical protein